MGRRRVVPVQTQHNVELDLIAQAAVTAACSRRPVGFF